MDEWTYYVRTGRLYEPDGEYLASGYSGLGSAKNDPDREREVATGPIPRGVYSIGEMYNSKRVGPFALPLEPIEHTNTFGRSAFRIHGDSIAHPGTASHGCIILPRPVRNEIARSAVKRLRVV